MILAEISGVDDCAAVTDANLASITQFGAFGLSTSNQGITSLQKGDFAGLTSLTILDLGGNSLMSLPEGIFDGLAELAKLKLASNTPCVVARGGVRRARETGTDQSGWEPVSPCYRPLSEFSGLTALDDLSLAFNELSSLPDEVFADLTALDWSLTERQRI